MFTMIVMAGIGQCNAAATYQRAATYAAPTYHATHHAANFVGFVAVDPYHSSTVGAAARVEARAAADAQATSALTTQIASLNATLAGMAGAPPEPQAAAPAAGPAGAGAPAPYASVIMTKCAGCHNPAKQSGGLSFVDDKGALLALDAETKFAMLDSVATKRMPKTKEAGSPEARRALADWLKADSDAILAALKDAAK